MIERLELRNLTVFTGLTLELSPKINVIIGENGTVVDLSDGVARKVD